MVDIQFYGTGSVIREIYGSLKCMFAWVFLIENVLEPPKKSWAELFGGQKHLLLTGYLQDESLFAKKETMVLICLLDIV